MEKVKKTFKIFVMMVTFSCCVIGYFGENLLLMVTGALAGYWILASILANRHVEEDDKEIDIIE